MRLKSSVSLFHFYGQKAISGNIPGRSGQLYAVKQIRYILNAGVTKLLLLTVLLASLSFLNLSAQTTFTATTSGNWTTIAWVKAGPSLASYPGEPGYGAEIHDVTINGAGITVTLNSNIVSSVRNVTLQSGTLDISSNSLTMTGILSGGATLTFTSGTLNIAGNNSTTGTFTAGSGTVNYNGGAQTVRGSNYYNLDISGSNTKTLNANTTVNNNLSITGTATLLTNMYQITGSATGLFNMAAGTGLRLGNGVNTTVVAFPTNFVSANISLNLNSTVFYQGNSAQTISAAPVYGNLTTASTNSKTLANNITVTGNLIIGVNTTLDASLSNYSINIAGSWTCNGTFNERQGKVIFNGVGAQSILNTLIGIESFYDLEFNSTGPINSSIDLAAANSLTMTKGIINMPGRTLTLGLSGANPGTLNYTAGWITGIFSRWVNPAHSTTNILFPVGDGSFGRSMSMNFSNISNPGLLSANFISSAPTPAGLPIVEGAFLFNQLFPEGYWNLTKDAVFTFTGTFDLSLVPSGFDSYPIDGETRIFSRFTASDWFANGTHIPGSYSLLLRNGLTSFTNNYAVAYALNCTANLINCPTDIVVNNIPGTCGNNVSWIPPSMSAACPGYSISSNYNPGDLFSIGTNVVAYYLMDGTLKMDSCFFNVIVNDIETPVVICKNINLYIGPSGTAILNGSDIDNGSSDNCSVSLVPDRTNFGCADVGLTIPVTLTGTDPSGNTANCTAQVTVLDTLPPVINIQTFELVLDASGNGTLLASDLDNGTFDNCTSPVILSVFPGTFTCSDVGSRTVTFTARDAYGNISSSNINITVKSSLVLSSPTLSSCELASPFALYKANVSGGDGNYSYFWESLDITVDPFLSISGTFPFLIFSDTSNMETPFFNNLMPDGTYTIRLTVTDGNGCSVSGDMIIVKSGPLFDNITVNYSNACEGQTASYSVSYDPLATYNWGVENGTILTGNLDTNRIDVHWNTGVTYGVVVATIIKTNIIGDACQSSVVDSVTINTVPVPQFNNPVTNACSNAVNTYTLTNTYNLYTWKVSGGSVVGGGTGGSNFVNVRWGTGPAGRVSVNVKNAAGCSDSTFVDVIISNLTGSVTSITNVTCNGAGNGSVTVAATPGTGVAPYQYSRDGGPYQVSGTFPNILPGIHNVTIRDAFLCTFDVNFSITQPTVLSATVSSTNVLCFGTSTGSITANGSGGTPPYQYSLDGGAFQASGLYNSLPAGIHALVVRDANLCVFNQNINITQPALALTGTITAQTNIACFGNSNGSVTVTGSGGVGPYQYRLGAGVFLPSGTFNSLSAGSYTITVRDANLCTFNVPVNIIGPAAALTGIIVFQSDVDCNGTSSGSVTVAGLNGTAPYNYSLDGGAYQLPGSFIGLPAGSYVITVRDANLCTFNVPVTIAEPPVLTGSISSHTDVVCNGDATGQVTIAAGGGTLPYLYSLDGGPSQLSPIFMGLTAGTYTVTIEDANNCSIIVPVTITEPPAIVATASSNSPVCETGTLNLTGGPGGMSTYLWTGPNGFTSLLQSPSISGATPIMSGLYTIVVTNASGCIATANINVTVTPTNTITPTSAAGTFNQTVCNNTPLASITYTTTGATGATFGGLPSGVTGNWAANVITISGTPLAAGSFNYLVTLTGGCGVVTANGTINVSSDNTIALTSGIGTNNQTVCIGSPVTNITYSTIGASGATFAGLPSGVTGNWAADVVTISGIPTVPGPFSYTVTLTGGCGVVTANGTITVTPDNTITLTSAPGTINQTLCFNAPIADITYLTAGASGANFAGLPLGVTGNLAANVVTISGIPTTAGTYNYTVTLTGGCGTAIASGIIRVNPINTITLTSALGTDNQTVCRNSPITTITYAVTGATGANFSGLPAGMVVSYLANTVTIQGTPTTSGLYTYTVTLTGGCGNVSITGIINVSAINTVSLTSGAGTNNQTVCINTAITNISYATTGATGATFGGLPAGVNGNWAANVINISGTPTASGTFNYTITLTGGCGLITAPGTLTVTPDNTFTLASAGGTDNQAVCINTPVTRIKYATTGATGANFAGLPTGVTGTWSADTVTISGTPSISGTFNYTITLTGGCGVLTPAGTIVVTQDNTIAITSAAGTDNQTTCINTAITNITYSTTGATGASIDGLPTGVTGTWAADIITISGTPDTSGVFSYNITLTGGCGSVTAAGTLVVTPANTVSLTSPAGTDNQTVCINSAVINIDYATTGATGATFAGLPAGVTGIWLADVATISGTPLVSGTFNYTVTLTGGCGVVTAPGTIVVTPDNTISITSPAGTDNQTLCINTPITDITYVTTGATGAAFAGLPTGVTGSWAADTVTISGIPSVDGIFSYTITLTGGCGTSVTNGTITVTPDNTINLTSAIGTDNQSICYGAPITQITYATTGATGAIFVGLPGGMFYSAAANTITIDGIPTEYGIFNYSVTLTGGCGLVVANGSITINPDNTISLISAPGTDNQTLCENTPVTDIVYLSTTATGASFSGLPSGVTGSWAADTITISGAPTVSGTFNYTVTLTGGCGVAMLSGSIVVNATPLMVINDPATVCSPAVIDLTAPSITTGSAPGLTFTYWTDSLATIPFLNYTAATAGTYYIKGSEPVGCYDIQPVHVTENPSPLGSTVVTNVLCFGGSTGAVNLTVTGGTSPLTFLWSNGASTEDISGLSAGIYSVLITDFAGCTANVSVTVSEPLAPLSGSTVVSNVPCRGGLTGGVNLTVTGGTSPYIFLWSNGATTEDLTNVAAGNYTVEITDANGCKANASGNVTQPAAALTGTTVVTSILCFGTNSGAIDLTAAGGTLPYTFLWSNGAVTEDISGVTAGTYTVTITDANLCKTTVNGTVNQPVALSVVSEVKPADCPDINNGSITVSVTGGISPYQYKLGSGAYQPTGTFNDLLPGSYIVTVMDGNLCEKMVDVEVTFNMSPACLKIPTVITPNGDGKNDTWIIKNIDFYPDAEVLVYNRWGELIFKTRNILANPWDGRYRDKLVPVDSYHYILYLNDGSQPRSGVITVIR